MAQHDVWSCRKSNFLLKKIKIRRPKHSLTRTPLRPITSHFCLTPHPPTPLKVGVISVSPLIYKCLFLLLYTINRKSFQVSFKSEFLLIYVLQYPLNSSIVNSNINANFTWFPHAFYDRKKGLRFSLIFLVSVYQWKSVARSFVYGWGERNLLQCSFNG